MENRKFFRLESKISATGFTTPQTSNQIDLAALAYYRHLFFTKSTAHAVSGVAWGGQVGASAPGRQGLGARK